MGTCASIRRGPRAPLRRGASQQGLPGRETLVGVVPEPDLVLAQLPAEQHVFFAALRREVEEPLVERLDLSSGVIDLLCAVGDRVGLALDRLREVVQVARDHVTAVPGDPRHEGDLLGLRGGEVPPVLNHALKDRAKLGEGGVGLLQREHPHPPMIMRPCALVKGKRWTSTSGAARRSGSRRSSRSSSSSRTDTPTRVAGTRRDCTSSVTSRTSGRAGTATSSSGSRRTATTEPRPRSTRSTPHSSRSSDGSSSATTCWRGSSCGFSPVSAPSSPPSPLWGG